MPSRGTLKASTTSYTYYDDGRKRTERASDDVKLFEYRVPAVDPLTGPSSTAGSR